MDHPFRSAAVGGFNRQDVLDYLEKTAAENAQKQQELEKQLEQQKQELAQKYYFEDEGDTQRFCTSWATTEDEVDMLVTDIEKL